LGAAAVSAEAASLDFDVSGVCFGLDSAVSVEVELLVGEVGRVSCGRGLVVWVAVVWAQAANTRTAKMADIVLMEYISINDP